MPPIKRPKTNESSSPVPWKKWPRSADVRAWMLTVLGLVEHIDPPRDRAESIIQCAIGELASIGHVHDALTQVERVYALLPEDAVSVRSMLLTQGAELALAENKLDLVEDYLDRALTLQRYYTRKVDVGCQDRMVRKFRARHGLLAPRDAADPQERVEAAFNGLVRSATASVRANDIVQAIAALGEAEKLLDDMPVSMRRHALASLAKAYGLAHHEEGVVRMLDQDSKAAPKERVGAAFLLRIGQRDRAVARYEEEAADALEKLCGENVNAHFPAMSLEHAIVGLADAGEMSLAKKWLDRALKDGTAWGLVAPGAFTSAVFASMAKAVARVEGSEQALNLVRLAMDRATADKKSDWRTAAIRSNAKLLVELSPPEEAERIARTIRSRSARDRLLARIYAARKDWDGLHAILSNCRTPAEAAELIWWTKFVWKPAS
jgi:hypothetical protein